jgi:hypothetical protein
LDDFCGIVVLDPELAVGDVTRTVFSDSAERRALLLAAFETVTRCWLLMLFILPPHRSLF